MIDCGTSAGATTDQGGAGFDRPVELSVAEGPQAAPQSPPQPVIRKPKCKKKHKRSAQVAKKKCKKKKHARAAIRFHAPPKSAGAWPDARHHHPFRLGR